MKRTVINWEQLSEIMDNTKFKEKPVEVLFEDGKLKSITFETKKDIKKKQ